MINFALEMKDKNYVLYICKCAELGLAPGQAINLEKFLKGEL